MGFLSKIFPKKQVNQNIYRKETEVGVSDGNVSGVARYLAAQGEHSKTANSHAKLTSVGEYLEGRSQAELTDVEKDEVNTRVNEKIEQRKSEEILMSAEDKKLSGVAKYVESQEQADKAAQLATQATTGVAKYLATIISNRPVATGVSKYISNRVDATVSSVDRYVINKALADKDKPKTVIIPDSSVTKYLESRPTMKTSRVAKYLAKKVISDKQVVA